MRKQTYSHLSNYLQQFSESLKKCDNLLLKSKQDNSFGKNVPTLLDEYHERDRLCKSINIAFDDLQDDFKSGRINLTVLRQHLKPLKDFFGIDEVTKSAIGKLHAERMLQQIEKYGC